MIPWLFLFYLLSSQTLGVSTSCPQNAHLNRQNHHCYWISEDQRSWHDARQACQQDPSADLAIINSVDVLDFVQQHFSAISTAWIGLIQSSVSRPEIYHWVDGTPGDTHVHWVTSKVQSGDCVQLQLNKEVTWSGISCHSKRYFICEKPHDVQLQDINYFLTGTPAFRKVNLVKNVTVMTEASVRGVTTVEMMLFPGLWFSHSGLVNSIEFVVQPLKKATRVHFKIFRPYCIPSLYLIPPGCEWLRTPFATCDTQPLCNTTGGCNNGHQWCHLQEKCLPITSPCSSYAFENITTNILPIANPPRYKGTQPYYSQVADIAMIISPDLNIVHVNVILGDQDVRVYPDDVIGFQHDAGPNSLLHCLSSSTSPWRQSYISLVRQGWLESLLVGFQPRWPSPKWFDNVVCDVRVLYTDQPQPVVPTQSLTTMPDTHLVTPVNRVNPTAINCCPLGMWTKITGMQIIYPWPHNGTLLVPTGNEVLIVIKINSGSNASSWWGPPVQQSGVFFDAHCPPSLPQYMPACHRETSDTWFSYAHFTVTHPRVEILNITVSNEVSSQNTSVEIQAYDVIQGLQIVPKKPRRVLVDVSQVFSAQVTHGTSVSFTWLIDNMELFAYSGQIYKVTFKQPATYRLKLMAVNPVSEQNIETELVADTMHPLTDPQFINLSGTVLVDKPHTFTFRIMVDSLADITFRWNFGDANATITHSRHPPHSAHLPEPDSRTTTIMVQDQMTWAYSQPGNYILQVESAAQWSCIRWSHSVYVRYPLTELSCAKAPEHPHTNGVIVFEAYPRPSSFGIFYTWNFGDGTPVVLAMSSTVQHRFRTRGIYNVTLQVNNTASAMSSYLMVTVEEEITCLEVTTSERSELGSTILVHAEARSGSNILWAFNMGDGHTFGNLTTDTIFYRYSVEGRYTITVTGSNAVSSVSQSVFVAVYALKVMAVKPTGCLVSGSNTSFQAEVSSTGNETQVCWSFGDRSLALVVRGSSGVHHTYAMAGNYTITVTATSPFNTASYQATICVQAPIHSVQLLARNLSVRLRDPVQFVAKVDPEEGKQHPYQYHWDFGVQGPPISSCREQSFVYDKVGIYLAVVTVSNRVDRQSSSCSVTVQESVGDFTIHHEGLAQEALSLNKTFEFHLHGASGTNATFYWDFGDGTARTEGQQVSHVYRSCGWFTMMVVGVNLVSRLERFLNVHVITPITQLSVSAAQLVVETGKSVTFTASLSTGEQVIFFWAVCGDCVLHPGSSSFKHSFLEPGTYSVVVTARNEVSEDTKMVTVQAEERIQDVKIDTGDLIHSSYFATKEVCILRAHVALGSNVSYEWTIRQGPVVVAVGQGSIMMFQPEAAGDYWLMVMAKNALGGVSQSEEISVLERISGVKVTSTPHNVATGQPVQLSVTVTSGTDLLYEWFIEGAENCLRTNISSLTYIYSTAGTTKVNVTVYNRLGSAQNSLVLTIQEPVCEVSYTVLDEALPFYLQTNATVHLKGFASRGTDISWEWCLLSPVCTQSWHSREINHTFSAAGVYPLTLNASNRVSWESVHHNLTVQDRVIGLVIELDKTTVRVGEPVTFTLNVHQGSMVRYFLHFVTLHTQLSLHGDTYKVTFPSVGQQNVTATARNEVSSEMCSASVVVLEEVTGLHLVNCCQSTVEANKEMKLTARVHTGTGVRYRWHLHLPGLPDLHGSGPGITYTPQSTGKLTVHVEAIGQLDALSLTECIQVQHPVSVAGKLWSDNVDLFVEQVVTFWMVLLEGTDVRYLWNFGDSPKTYTSQNGTVQHRYKTVGWYTVEAKVFNDVSSVVVRLVINVRQPACWAPEVRLVKPPPTVVRARASYFEAKVDLKGCTAYQARYRWELLEGTSCHSSSVRVPLSTVDTGKPILALPKLALPLGAHCLQFTVDLVSTPLSQKVAVVIQVVQSKLLAIISGGSERTWASHQDLVLDGSKSYDPDVEMEEEAFLTYHWVCEAVDYLTSPCIHPGISVGPVVTIPRNILLPGVTYLFTLTVTKLGKQAAHTTQTVLVRAGEIPCVMLECISCHVLWSYGVSRSTHVTLAGRCQNCSNKSSYKWIVQSSDAYPLILDNKTTSTGDSSPNLVVRQGVLQDGINYTFTLSITDPEKETTGFSSITLTPNYPPSGGECTIQPDQMFYLLETLLSFNCTGWWDEDGGLDQLVYSLMAITCPYDSSSCDRFLLYRGIKPSSSVLLPAATSGRASTVRVLVQVEDLLGARTLAINRTLMVLMPDFLPGSYSVIDWLKHKSQSELWGLVQQGNPSEVIPYAVTVISALNQYSRHREHDLRDRITIRSNITQALTSMTVATLEDVKQISAALAQCVAFPEEFIMGQGLEGSLRITRQMIDIIGNQAGQGSATPSEAGRNILRILGAALPVIDVGANNGTQRQDDLFTSATIFQLISKLVQALMRSRVLNEEPLLLSVSEIDVQGKRVDPFNLLCAWPGEQCLFHIPQALSSQLSANRELIQLTMSLRINPFPGGTISNYSVSTHLGSMELSSSQGLPVPINGLATERSIRVTLADRRPRQREHPVTVKTLSPGESVNFTVRPVNSNRAAGLHIDLRFTLIDLHGAQDPDPFVQFHVHNNPLFNGSPYNATRGIILHPTREHSTVEHTIFLSPEVYDSTTELLIVTVSNRFSSARVSITITIYTSLCQYFDFQSLQWRTEGIVPTHWTRLEEAVCLTRHLTLFGASLFVSPNAVEFLAPADKPVQNIVVAISCTLVFVVYTVMALIAHKLDYIDINRVGIIPLCGQHGQYKYEVMVKTGWCRNAGTTAHVGISLYGLNKSGSRHLDKEGAFQRNSLDIFQIETDANLGEIWKIRIWHDNTGLSPSWHLEHVAVWDKQTDIMYYFLAQDWLSVENEKNEGIVEKDVLAACPQELRRFSRIFVSQLKRGVSEKHIWLSVWDRLPRSHFTRVQRLTCCTLLMYLFLTAAATWYGAVGAKKESFPVAYLTTVTGETVAVGIVLAFVVFPIHFLFTCLFRRIRSQVTMDDPEGSIPEAQTVGMDMCLDPSELGSSSFLSIPGGLDSIADASSESCESHWSKKLDSGLQFPPQLFSKSFLKSWPSYDSLFDLPDFLNHDASFNQNKILKRKKALRKQVIKSCSSLDEDPLSLSIADSYDSWSLKHNQLTTSDEDLMRSIAAEVKQQGGLSDQVTSDSGHFSPRAEMDLISETLESSSSTWSDLGEKKLHIGALHQSSSFLSSRGTTSSFLSSRGAAPTSDSVFSTRIGILKRPKKWMLPHSILYATYIICFLLIAVCVSVTVSYGMLFPNRVVLMWLISAFFSFLTSFFVLEPIKVLCEAVILALFTKPVDADEDDKLVEEPLVKKTGERIGKVRAPYGYSLLQAKEEARKVRALHTLMKNCVVHTFFFLVVLVINYQGCYQNANGRLLQASIRQSIVGRTLHSSNFSAIQRPADFRQWLDTVLLPQLYNNPQLTLIGALQLQYVRSQKGHCSWWIYRLTPVIHPGNSCDHANSLSTEIITQTIDWSAEINSTHHNWVYSSDDFTRTESAYVEFTQYSRDVDLYAVVTLLVVFQPTLPVKPAVVIKPVPVLSSSRGVDLLLVLMVLLLLFSLCFLVAEAIALKRDSMAYFKEGHRYLQLLIILLCILIPGLHFSHIRLADRQLSLYKYNPQQFVSFYHVACLAEGVTSLAAFLLTILTLKIIGQFRFVRRWCVFGRVFQCMIRELMAAFLCLFLIVMVYAQCGYVVFSPTLEHFVTFSSSLLTLVAFPRGTLSLRHAVHHYPIIAPLYFLGYVLCLTWIARNFFSAIINQSYKQLKAEMYRPAIEPQDYEMIEFFIKRFKLWIGLTKTKEFRHKVKFEGMESLPTGTSQTLRLSQLASESTESPFSDCTILLGSVQSEELTLPKSPTSEIYKVETYLDRLLPTVNSLLGQFDRVNKVTDDLYRIESDLEKVQHRINQRRQTLGKNENSKAERQNLTVPRACSAVSDSAVSSLRPSTGPAREYSAVIAQSAHSALPDGSRSSDAPGRRAWQSGPPLSAGIGQRAVWSSEPAAKPRPKSEEGQDRVMTHLQAPVKRRAWQSESMEGKP
ncbi:polycystin-1 [Stegostoma tigrinum]|uniref:polycystin-1 n=1 Tax=Stegostoma tigrinum TaxID=3053191 RepID=UPI002870376B|nr:polycystin-1 [Stegostoma tigrinum]